MATRDELYAALRNADKAGDSEGAAKLASYIQSLPAEDAAPVTKAVEAQPQRSGLRPDSPLQMRLPGRGPVTMGEYGGNPDVSPGVGSAIVRPVAKAIAGLPLMAADAGVGTVNTVKQLIAEKRLPRLNDFNPFATPAPADYPLPSQTFNEALDSATVKPTTTAGKGAELVSSMLLGARMPAPTGVQGPPPGFMPPAQALKDASLQAGQKAGYVVPPSSNNPTFMNRLMEGIAGKAKLSQEAMMRNQPVTERLAATALGQNPEAPLTQEALAVIRSEAHAAGYAPVKAAGEMATDSKFIDDLVSLTKTGEGASRSFPGLKPPGPLDDLVKSLTQEKFDAGDGVDAIAYLRQLADDAFGAGQSSTGRAYKGAAKAVEDVIERNLSKRGKDSEGLLKGYRDSRRLIAQTYTAGKALVDADGTSSALKYGRELMKGVPLVGGQKTIGQFAARFGKFAGVPKEVYPSISPLDVYGSAISAGVTNSAVPLMLPLTRVGLREYLLSQAGQARAFPKAFKPPQNLGAIAGAYPQLGLMAGP